LQKKRNVEEVRSSIFNQSLLFLYFVNSAVLVVLQVERQVQWEDQRDPVHRYVWDRAPIASRRVLSRVLFPVIRHSTENKIDWVIKRPRMEAQPEVAWLVTTLRDWGLPRASHFSPSYRRGSPNGESFVVLSVLAMLNVHNWNKHFSPIVCFSSYKSIMHH